MPLKGENNIPASGNPEESALDKFWREYEEGKNNLPVEQVPVSGSDSDPNEDDFGDIYKELDQESAEGPVQKAREKFGGVIAQQQDNPFLTIARKVNPYNKNSWQIYDLNFEMADIKSNITSETPDDIKDRLNKELAKKREIITKLKEEESVRNEELEILLVEIKRQYPDLDSLDLNHLKEIGTLYTKELINQIYYNLDLAQKNQGPKAEILAGLLINSDDFIRHFVAIKGQKNLFEQLFSYNQEKLKNNDQDKLRDYLDQSIKSEAVRGFILELDKLSGQLGQDILDSILRRQDLERQITSLVGAKKIFSYYDEKFGVPVNMEQQYGTADDHIQQILNNYKKLEPVMAQLKVESKKDQKEIPESLRILHEDVQNIIKFEIKLLDQNVFEYAQMSKDRKQKLREKFMAIAAKTPQEIFDLEVLGFLGECIEKRYQEIDQIVGKHATISRQFSREFL